MLTFNHKKLIKKLQSYGWDDCASMQNMEVEVDYEMSYVHSNKDRDYLILINLKKTEISIEIWGETGFSFLLYFDTIKYQSTIPKTIKDIEMNIVKYLADFFIKN